MGFVISYFLYFAVQTLSNMKYQTEFAKGSTIASVRATLKENLKRILNYPKPKRSKSAEGIKKQPQNKLQEAVEEVLLSILKKLAVRSLALPRCAVQQHES